MDDYDRGQAEKWGQPPPNYYQPQQPPPNYYQPQQQMQQPSLYPLLAKKRRSGLAIAALVCSICAAGLFFLAFPLVMAGAGASAVGVFFFFVSLLLQIAVAILLIIFVAQGK